jgi:hypothetical protein
MREPSIRTFSSRLFRLSAGISLSLALITAIWTESATRKIVVCQPAIYSSYVHATGSLLDLGDVFSLTGKTYNKSRWSSAARNLQRVTHPSTRRSSRSPLPGVFTSLSRSVPAGEDVAAPRAANVSSPGTPPLQIAGIPRRYQPRSGWSRLEEPVQVNLVPGSASVSRRMLECLSSVCATA